MSSGYKTVELYGGAITGKVPTDYLDVSDIRQVPDTQEVFLSASGFSSLSIDICDRVDDQPDDVAALQYHFEDFVDDTDTHEIHVKHTNVELPQFSGVPVLSLIATVKPPTLQEGRPLDPKAPTFTVILFALVRLEQQMTDLEIVLNLPNIPDTQELVKEGEDVDFAQAKYGSAVNDGVNVFKEFLESLHIKDWGLFGPGG